MPKKLNIIKTRTKMNSFYKKNNNCKKIHKIKINKIHKLYLNVINATKKPY